MNLMKFPEMKKEAVKFMVGSFSSGTFYVRTRCIDGYVLYILEKEGETIIMSMNPRSTTEKIKADYRSYVASILTVRDREISRLAKEEVEKTNFVKDSFFRNNASI